MTRIQHLSAGPSRSFPAEHPMQAQAVDIGADVLVITGAQAGAALQTVKAPQAYQAILVELGMECLGVHTGENQGLEGSNVLGFARYQMGQGPLTQLVELVRQPHTPPEAIAAAKAWLADEGLVVAVCADTPGRIVDRLIRPYLNSVLRRLDDGLASAADMDKTLKLGLGYPEGPLSMLERTGLAEHHEVTQALYQALGQPGFAPARRAQVAQQIAAQRDAS
jgi:3-hydroxybutyryl-CoA dehydrogenase